MKRSNRLMILIGVFLAIVSFVGVVLVAGRGPGGGPQPTASATPVPDVTVVYATKDITIGTTITEDMVDVQTMRPDEKAALADNADLYSIAKEVVGLRAGSNITKGGFIYRGSFTPGGGVKQGEDLAPTVKSGMRAIALEVDQVNGVGTLLVPGDHVDVVLSVWVAQLKISDLPVKGASGNQYKATIDGGKDVTTKLVIQNRKILATLTPPPVVTPENPNPSATPQPTDNSVRLSTDHMIVIVEVTPQEAEVIRWGQREEKVDPQNYITLGLALRSKDDDEAANVNTQGVTLKVLVDKWGVMPPDPMAVLPKGLSEAFKW